MLSQELFHIHFSSFNNEMVISVISYTIEFKSWLIFLVGYNIHITY